MLKLSRACALTFSLVCLLPAGLALADDEETERPDPKELDDDLLTVAQSLIERGQETGIAWDLLEGLVTEVGPRFAGTAGDRAAVSWALTELRELGFESIETEEVEVPRWVRGDIKVEITEPYPQDMVALALGGSPGTPDDGIQAPVVAAENVEALQDMDRSEVEGRIVFLSERMEATRDASGYAEVVPNRSAGPAVASEMGAVATVIRSVGSSDERVAHTGGTRFPDDVDPIPAAALPNPDADMLERQLDTGRTVKLDMHLTARELSPTTSANVIAEVPGRDPDAGVVLLGAHLDSWDITPGAHDDAAGVAIVTTAARLISELDRQPRRTLRVVLYANEEFGLSGAQTYAENRSDNLEEHFIALGADLGGDRVWRFDTVMNEDALATASAMFELIEPLGVEWGDNDGYGIPDFIPLREQGVPILDPVQDATRYFDIHHTINDTLDKVDPESLQQNVAIYAALAWLAANVEEDFRPTPVVADDADEEDEAEEEEEEEENDEE